MLPLITFRPPVPFDGAAVFRLIERCPPLDPNSLYCNLLQVSHFAATCVVAEQGNELVGFVSGYLPPQQADTLFTWQVAVSEHARGQGLAKQMLLDILARPGCRLVTQLQTTITENNKASWRLFESVASQLRADLSQQPHFLRTDHFNNRHDTEYLVSIGPFTWPGESI